MYIETQILKKIMKTRKTFKSEVQFNNKSTINQ